MAAVGSGQGAATLPYIGGNRRSTGIADAPDRPPAESGIGVFFYLIDIHVIGVHHKLIYIVIIVAVLWSVF
jgi:hypothetical protein